VVELSDILAYSDEKRRNLRLKPRKIKRRNKSYERVIRPERSEEELLEYFKDNEITSIVSLLKTRQDGDPMPYDYVKAFGSWQKVKNMVYGEPTLVPVDDPEYMIKCIIEFNLWTRPVYEEARKLRPDILPSLYQILKYWGRWSNLTQCAYEASFKKTLDTYLNFQRRLGRVPSVKDCKKENIKLGSVISFFGTKKELDKFLITVENNDEKK